MFRTLVAAVAAAGLASCQSFQSSHVDLNADQMADGLHYAVPKALMTIELRQQGGRLWLGVSRPFLVGDPEATYALSASSGLFASQRYKLRVDPQTRLLDYINSVSQGQATQILANLAQSAGVGQGMTDDFKENDLASEEAVQVFSKVFDPMAAGCDFGRECVLWQLSNEIHAKAREFLRCNSAGAGPNAVRCRELGLANDTFQISITPMFEVQTRPSTGRQATAASGCSAAICYRAPAPYLMRVYVRGSRDVSEIVMLPNKAPIMSLGLPAGVFATARSRVDLVHGMPARVEIDQGNELVGITAIPLTIVDSFFDSVSQVLQFRIDYNTKYGEIIESERARRENQDAYNDFLAEREASRAPAPVADGAGGNEPDNFEDEGIAPENTAVDYLEEDDEIVDQARMMNVTILPEPEALLFSVPLQPDDFSDDGDGTTSGALDGTDSGSGEAPE